MTTFPLTAPTSPGFANVQMNLLRATALSQSPYTMQQQAIEYPGAVWQATVSLPPILRAQAAKWQAMIIALRGRSGTFLMGKSAESSPRGTATAATMNGAATHQATSLVVDGMGASKTLLAGDYFAIDNHLYMITADATANGSGQATLTFEPGLRDDYADNTSLTLTNPLGTWRMMSDNIVWTIDQANSYGVTFSCIEAI